MPNLRSTSVENIPSLHSTVEEEEEVDIREGGTSEWTNMDIREGRRVDMQKEKEEEEEKEEVEAPTFSVGDIRRRLTEEFEAPLKNFPRDPEDPSGVPTLPLFLTPSLSFSLLLPQLLP